MTPVKTTRRLSASRGSAIIEFSISAFTLLIIAFATIELGRMLLVYTTVADSARAGVRYAIVHGKQRTAGVGTVDGPSTPGNTTQVVTVVKNFAGAGLLDINRLTVRVEYPDSAPENAPGKRVTVTVVYPYDPFTTILPLRVPLGTTTQGIIVF
jgi:Flp pilus assembly protein TadG